MIDKRRIFELLRDPQNIWEEHLQEDILTILRRGDPDLEDIIWNYPRKIFHLKRQIVLNHAPLLKACRDLAADKILDGMQGVSLRLTPRDVEEPGAGVVEYSYSIRTQQPFDQYRLFLAHIKVFAFAAFANASANLTVQLPTSRHNAPKGIKIDLGKPSEWVKKCHDFVQDCKSEAPRIKDAIRV